MSLVLLLKHASLSIEQDIEVYIYKKHAYDDDDD